MNTPEQYSTILNNPQRTLPHCVPAVAVQTNYMDSAMYHNIVFYDITIARLIIVWVDG